MKNNCATFSFTGPFIGMHSQLKYTGLFKTRVFLPSEQHQEINPDDNIYHRAEQRPVCGNGSGYQGQTMMQEIPYPMAYDPISDQRWIRFIANKRDKRKEQCRRNFKDDETYRIALKRKTYINKCDCHKYRGCK